MVHSGCVNSGPHLETKIDNSVTRTHKQIKRMTYNRFQLEPRVVVVIESISVHF